VPPFLMLSCSFLYLDRAGGSSPQMEALIPRGRPISAAEPAAAKDPATVAALAGLGVDISGRRFLGNSTQTRRFLTLSLQASSQNQGLSEDAISSEMTVSPWHF